MDAYTATRLAWAWLNGNPGPAIRYGLRRALNGPRRRAGREPWVLGSDEDRERFVRWWDGLPSGLAVVLGARGSGKTALTTRLAERRGRPTYVLGMPQSVLPDSGQWQAIGPENVEQIPNRSTVIIDDAGLYVDSHKWGSDLNELVRSLVMTLRHREIILIVNSQYASSINKYVLDADALFLRPPGMLWRAIERPELTAIFEQAEAAFASLEASERRTVALVLSPVFQGGIVYAPPTWYGDAQSRNKAHGVVEGELISVKEG